MLDQSFILATRNPAALVMGTPIQNHEICYQKIENGSIEINSGWIMFKLDKHVTKCFCKPTPIVFE